MKEEYTLQRLFGRMLNKQGFTTTIYNTLDIVEFKNYYIRGTITFDKDLGIHKIRWIAEKGYQILDIPSAGNNDSNIYVSCIFHTAGELLNFLQRRLIWKKNVEPVYLPF